MGLFLSQKILGQKSFCLVFAETDFSAGPQSSVQYHQIQQGNYYRLQLIVIPQGA